MISRTRARRRAVARLAAAMTLATLALVTAPAWAARGNMQGHLSIGYAKLFATSAPGGSLSVAAGLELPVARQLSAGLEFGYDLLGARSIERGSLFADVNYNAFEALGLLHWSPGGAGPLAVISAGPGLFNARADISASAGGAQFRDAAIAQTVLGAAVSITLMPRREAPVRAGLELGARYVPVDAETWTLFSARVAIHY